MLDHAYAADSACPPPLEVANERAGAVAQAGAAAGDEDVTALRDGLRLFDHPGDTTIARERRGVT